MTDLIVISSSSSARLAATMRTRVPNEQNTAPQRPSRPQVATRLKPSTSAANSELSEDVMEFILSSNNNNNGATASASLPAGQRSLTTPRATMILSANPNVDTTNLPFETYLPAEAMALTSPSIEDILGLADSSEGPLFLPPDAKRGRRPPPSADEEAMSEASDAKRPRDQRSEVDEDDERVRQRKAQSARSSRLKHKEYVKALERENERLRSSHAELDEVNQVYKGRIKELENRVDYLHRVIANDSAIARIVGALPGVEGVQLSSSLASVPAPVAAPDVEAQFVNGGGVCLHLVDNKRVSLELCAECARKARAAKAAEPPKPANHLVPRKIEAP